MYLKPKSRTHGGNWDDARPGNGSIPDLGRSSGLILHRFVGNLQATIDDGKTFAKLLFVDAQRRVREEGIPSHKGVKAFLAEELSQSCHFVRSSVEGRERLAGVPAANQFDNAE